MAATRALRELLGGCDPTSPEERDALFDRYAAIHGEPPCWDAYDFAVYCPIDPASAASLPVGSRPRVPSPGPAGAARPVSEPPTSPATLTYDIEMAQRARRHPAELLVLLGLHLGRRSSATGWLEPLRVVGAFLGRTWWFAGRCAAVIAGHGGGGVAALGHPGHGLLVSASTDGTLSCWSGCTTLMSEAGRGPVTCFACLHAGPWACGRARDRPPPPLPEASPLRTPQQVRSTGSRPRGPGAAR